MSNQYTVLIVDDELFIRTLLEDFLSPTYSLFSAGDGAQAWEVVQEQDGKIDVILCDMNMPVMDGVSLLQRVKAAYPDICVIMMSGTSDVHSAIKAIRQGAYDYISKPISELDEINILIQRWANQQTLEAKLVMYADLQKEILNNLKVRTFMGIDVVGSKSIKSGEDPLLIHYSFLAYHRFVEAIVLKNGGQIHSTAGDGVMSCFILPQAAIESAKQILSGLDDFNAKQNRLTQTFALRIGIHSGTVVVEESGRVNEMYSESLDLTGHIQKVAKSNQIEVSEGTVELLSEKANLEPLGEEVGGFPIYVLRS